MGIVLGLAAALFWGVSDFLVRKVTQEIGTYRTLFFMQFIGLVALSIYLVGTGELAYLLKVAGWHAWLLAALVAVLNIFSTLALYRSFEVGTMVIVSPIAASSSALTVLLALLSGERLNEIQAIGIGAALLGVILTATQIGPSPIAHTPSSQESLLINEHAVQHTTSPPGKRHNVSHRVVRLARANKAALLLNGQAMQHTTSPPVKRQIASGGGAYPASGSKTLLHNAYNASHTVSSPAQLSGVSSSGSSPVRSSEKPLVLNRRDTISPAVIRSHILGRGVGWALAASAGYGLTFWLLGIYITPALGGIAPIWLIRLVTPCVLSLCAFPLRQSFRLPKGNIWWLIFTVSVLDTAAFVCTALGLATRQVAIVSVLASLFSAVTVVLAWIFLRDRLRLNQWIGILIIFLGIILVKV